MGLKFGVPGLQMVNGQSNEVFDLRLCPIYQCWTYHFVRTSLVPFPYTRILSVLSVWFKLDQLVQMCVCMCDLCSGLCVCVWLFF